MVSGKMNPSARVSVPPHIAFNELAGEAVLLNLTTGKYYSLDAVGARMFALLQQTGRLDQTAQAFLQEYDVSPAQLEGDLTRLVDELAAQGLIIIDGG